MRREGFCFLINITYIKNYSIHETNYHYPNVFWFFLNRGIACDLSKFFSNLISLSSKSITPSA